MPTQNCNIINQEIMCMCIYVFHAVYIGVSVHLMYLYTYCTLHRISGYGFMFRVPPGVVQVLHNGKG